MSQDRGQAHWQAIWRSRGLKARLLVPLAWLYGGLWAVRRGLYRLGWFQVERMPVPVVVVGNVVVGGAGKTPTVLALIEHLRARGWHPGVVSRGYGRQGSTPFEVKADSPPENSGDEPALIRRETGVPVFVARRRADAARALLATYPAVNILLCDDGLQHLALGRDLAIAVFDDRGTGNGWLLPAGLLREPWPPRQGSGFAPHMVLQQSARHAGATPSLPGKLPTYHATRALKEQAVNATGQTALLSTLAHPQPAATAGIARPEAFFEMLRREGIALSQTFALPDHADAAAFESLLRQHQGTLLCTEKDAVKLFDALRRSQAPSGDAQRVWSIGLSLNIEPAFFDAVDAQLAGLRPKQVGSARHG